MRKTRRCQRRRLIRGWVGVLLTVGALSSCGPADPIEPLPEVARKATAEGRVFRIGDVDPDTPARRTRRLQPLADYLAEQLADLGFARGGVVIARDLREMGRFMSDGRVDLYVDSTFPTLMVQRFSGSRILLHRWAQGSATYWSLFVTASESGISSLEQLRGSVLALQESYSTSGFVLPAGTLIERGFELSEVGGPEDVLKPDAVNYFFSRDEENTIELVITGKAPAGAISNQEYEQLPEPVRDQLRVIGRTVSVPRQLVSTRVDLEPQVVDRVSKALLGLTPPDGEPVALEAGAQGWTWKFQKITPATAEGIARLAKLVELLAIE